MGKSSISTPSDQFVRDIIARLGEIHRLQLTAAQVKAAERLVAAGALRVRWYMPDDRDRWCGGPERKVYYDPHWTPPPAATFRGEDLRVLRGGKA